MNISIFGTLLVTSVSCSIVPAPIGGFNRFDHLRQGGPKASVTVKVEQSSRVAF